MGLLVLVCWLDFVIIVNMCVLLCTLLVPPHVTLQTDFNVVYTGLTISQQPLGMRGLTSALSLPFISFCYTHFLVRQGTYNKNTT